MNNAITEEKSNTGQVTQQVQRQSNLAGELNELVDKLEKRLADVVAPLPKQEPIIDDERVSMPVLAGQIEASNDLVERCIKTLYKLITRIEI